MSKSLRWMFAALAAGMMFDFASEASAQVRADVRAGGANVRVGGGGFRLFGRRPWFANEGVRTQLKIDDDQYNSLNRTYTQYWTPYNQAVTTLPADVDEAERQRRMQAAYGTFHKNYYDNTSKVFTDADTRNRYNQLNWQYQGYAAFNDPQVQTRLRLTDEQRQNFNRYYTDWNKQMNTYATEYSRDRDGVNKQFGEHWKQQRARINETLTPEQRQAWNEMTGEAHDFSADVYFDDGDDAREGARDGRDNPRREEGRDNPRRDDAGRDNPPRNPAPGAGPRENPPRNPAPGAGPRENPPRNPAPGASPRENPPRNPRADDREPAPQNPAPREPAPANPR